MALNQSPRFWFRVAEMRPRQGQGFPQREDASGHWKPPGGRHSNMIVSNTHSICYLYDNWQTQQAIPPNTPRVAFKTFSIYADPNRFWIHRGDATQLVIGDAEVTDDDGYRSDSSNGDGIATDDWSEISFHWHTEPQMVERSYARERQAHGNIHRQIPASRALSELLPDRYLAPPQRRNALPNQGGLTGELPLLIGLTALSVPPSLVDSALRHCVRGRYQPHQQPREAGWQTTRGVVVRVEYEPTPTALSHRGQPEYDPRHDPTAQRLWAFEQGRTVYGSFAN